MVDVRAVVKKAAVEAAKTVAVGVAKEVVKLNAARAVVTIAQMGVNKGAVVDVGKNVHIHVLWDVNIIVYMDAVLVVTISVLLAAKILAKQHAYKDVTMAAEILVEVVAPTVVLLDAVDCYIIVVMLELDILLHIKNIIPLSFGKKHHIHCYKGLSVGLQVLLSCRQEH